MAEKTEKNPRGAGRKATGIKRVSINISGQPEQIQKLKQLAKESGKNTSQFIFEKTGVIKMEKRTFYIAYFDGSESGYVDYEGEPTHNLDNAMTFDSESSAEAFKTRLQAIWKSPLEVEVYPN